MTHSNRLADKSKGDSNAPPPFKFGIVHESVDPSGRDRATLERVNEAARKAPKQPTVTDRHKKWLKELQKQREELIREKQQLEQEQEERHRRFRERQAKMRREVVEGIGSGDEPQERTQSPPDQSQKQRKSKSKKGKPAWALTEEAHREQEEKEAENLLQFVEDLDIDHYLDDLEVRASLEAVKRRIEALERRAKEAEREQRRKERREAIDVVEVGPDDVAPEDPGEGWEWVDDEWDTAPGDTHGAAGQEAGDEDAASSTGAIDDEEEGGERRQAHGRRRRRRRRRRVAQSRESDMFLEGQENADALGGDRGDTRSLADSMLSSTDSVRSVHSRRSLNALIERAKRERTEREQKLSPMESIPEGRDGADEMQSRRAVAALPPVEPPRMVTEHENKGAQEEKKHLVGLLPYQHRNPAV